MALYDRIILPTEFQDEDYLLALLWIHECETLEYPLYAVWGPFLRECVRPSLDKHDVIVVTYAQASVDRNFRPLEDEYIIMNIPTHGGEPAAHRSDPPSPTPNRAPQAGDRILRYDRGPNTPSSSSLLVSDPAIGNILQRSSGSAQALIRQLEHQLISPLSVLSSISEYNTSPVVATNPGIATNPVVATNPTLATSSSMSPTAAPRSYRIPDFMQRYFFASQDETGEWTCESMAQTPPLLIVEIKSHPEQYDKSHLIALGTKVSRQTEEQAQYAFQSYPSMQVIGVIQALGYRWRYLEYKRSELPGLRSLSEEKDSTYAPNEDEDNGVADEDVDVFSGNNRSVAAEQSWVEDDLPQFIKPYFGEQVFLDLLGDYEASKKALRAIGEQIYNTFNERVWHQLGGDAEEPDDDDMGMHNDDGDVLAHIMEGGNLGPGDLA